MNLCIQSFADKMKLLRTIRTFHTFLTKRHGGRGIGSDANSRTATPTATDWHFDANIALIAGRHQRAAKRHPRVARLAQGSVHYNHNSRWRIDRRDDYEGLTRFKTRPIPARHYANAPDTLARHLSQTPWKVRMSVLKYAPSYSGIVPYADHTAIEPCPTNSGSSLPIASTI